MSKNKKNNKKNTFYHSNHMAHIQGTKVDISELGTQLIALDSNVFIDMAHEMIGRRRHADSETENFYDRLSVIRQMAEEGKLKFVIPPTVLDEITVHGLSRIELQFMQKYCVVMQPKNEREMAQKVSKLTMEYIRNGVIQVGNTAHPYGDAMIMAQATVAGLNLLSNNYRDFEIYKSDKSNYKRDEYGDIIPKKGYNDTMLPKNVSYLNENELTEYLKIKGRFRALDIGKLNRSMGYAYENVNGFRVTPMPFTTIDFIGKEKEEEGLWLSSQFTSKFNSEEFDLVNYEQNK